MPPDKPNEDSFNPAAHLTELSGRQQDEIDDKSRPSAALIHETIRAEGVAELERGLMPLALSALAAGLSMGFSLIVQGSVSELLSPGPLRELLSPLGYSIGFLIVVLGRQQLFTENTLTPMLPLLHNHDLRTLWQVARLWAVVLLGNVLGAILAAIAIAHSGAFEPHVMAAFTSISRGTLSAGFEPTLVRGIYAGWLIALMVWLLPAVEGSRPHVIIIITYVVALAKFTHIIAGSVECAYLVQLGDATWRDFGARFFVPTLLGNIVGGVTLVAVLNYGQVAAEIKPAH